MTQVDKPKRLGYSCIMKTHKLYVEVKVPIDKAQKDAIPDGMSLRDFLCLLLLREKPDFSALDSHGKEVIEEVAAVIETGKFFYYEKGDPEYQERIRLIGARHLGKLGGSSKSKAKSAASRSNGKLGGRPRINDDCKAGHHQWGRDEKTGRRRCVECRAWFAQQVTHDPD